MALLSFDAETGVVAPDTADIRAQVASDFVSAFNTGDGSPELDTEAATPAGQLVDSVTSYLAQGNGELMYLANQFNPMTAEGIFQEALGKIYFLTRKVAAPTSVWCVCTGLDNTVIPAGAMARDDNGIFYQCASAVTIGTGGTSGQVVARFLCMSDGAVEVAVNTLKTIVTVIPGWDTINNPYAVNDQNYPDYATVIGNVVESQRDFEMRRFLSVAKNAQGSAMALQGAISEITGVVDCVVLENCETTQQTLNGVAVPPHSVAICIYGSFDSAAIAAAIYQKKSAGCGTQIVGGSYVTEGTVVSYTDTQSQHTYNFEILRPAEQHVTITVTGDVYSGIPSDLVNIVRNAIIADFNGQNTDSKNTRVGMSQTVYASRFGTAVIVTAGIPTLKGITIALGGGAAGDSINIPADVEPVISPSDITVSFT